MSWRLSISSSRCATRSRGVIREESTMMTCGQCGVRIEDTTRIDCAVCGAATLGAVRETEIDLRSVTGVLPAVVLDELELATDAVADIETTHEARLVRRFELGENSRPQSAVLH